MPGLDETMDFIRQRTAPAPVPLVPEVVLYQATELTPLWRATAAELHAWDDSPFWAFPWAGGQVLARHLLDRPELVRGRAVLDFATGSGLVAIAALKAGARSAIAFDLDPFCEAAVRLNAERNGVQIPFRAGSPIGDAAEGIDVLLAGDVFYERRLAEDSLHWFADLAARGVYVLAGDAWRTYAPQDGFEELCIHDVPTSLEIEGGPFRTGRVLRILPPPVGANAERT